MHWIYILKALLARILFITHGVVATWRVVEVEQNTYYWALCVPLCLYAIETVVTLKTLKGGEWKWINPSVLLFLLCDISAIWLLENNLLQQRLDVLEEDDLESCTDIQLSTNESSFSAYGITIPVSLTDEAWILGIEQTMLCLLLVGRWLLPLGDMTRDQLSQLLLVNIGMAADSIEFITESIKEDTVSCSQLLVYLILSIWGWSLLQFTLTLTVTKARRPRPAVIAISDEENPHKVDGDSEEEDCFCCRTETWGMVVVMFMQDVPFLIMRLYIMIGFQVVNQMMLFFTVKNVFVIALQVYRLCVIRFDKNKVNISDEK